MRPSSSLTAPVLMGLTLAAFGAVTPSATAQAAHPQPDPLGMSQLAPVHPAPGAPGIEAGKPTHAVNRALIVHVTSCSEADLQAAIGAVATVGGTVTLKPRCIYTLTDAAPANGDNGLPAIKNKVTINGYGDTITRAATAANFRFFEIDGPNGNLTLDALTLSNGHATTGLGNGRGGAVWLNGVGPTLTLEHTSLTANTADTFGGAIDNDNGALSVNESTLYNNRASAGGALFVSPFGGSGTAVLDESGITVNRATNLGGGIAAAVGTTVVLNGSRVTGNDVTGANPQGGGIAQAGTMTLKRCHIMGNTTTGNNAHGGGIYNVSGTVKLTVSPVTGNTSDGPNSRGGGIYNTAAGTVTLTASRVTKNQALGTNANGGGIFNAGGTVTRTDSPVRGNQPNNCGNPSTVPGCSE